MVILGKRVRQNDTSLPGSSDTSRPAVSFGVFVLFVLLLRKCVALFSLKWLCLSAFCWYEKIKSQLLCMPRRNASCLRRLVRSWVYVKHRSPRCLRVREQTCMEHSTREGTNVYVAFNFFRRIPMIPLVRTTSELTCEISRIFFSIGLSLLQRRY